MPDPCTGNTFRIATAAHGGFDYDQPIGASITENITWMRNTGYSTTVTPTCLAIEEYQCSAKVTYRGLVTPEVRGTKSDLTITLLAMDSSTTVTVAVANMVAGANDFDFTTRPNNQTANLEYQGDTLTPISVS